MLSTLRTRGLLWPTVTLLLCLPILIGLGTWQLQRRDWKNALVAEIEAGFKSQPIELETVKDWATLKEYQPVIAKGVFRHDLERYVFAIEDGRAGWYVHTPLELPQRAGETAHWTVLINRGFVPEELKDPAKRQAGQIAPQSPQTLLTVTGYVRGPGEKNMFTPETTVGSDTWYWRDLNGMATSVGLNAPQWPYLPFFVEAKAEPANPGGWPRGGVTHANIPNRHLEYALTWYGLAAAFVGVWLAYVVGRVRSPEG